MVQPGTGKVFIPDRIRLYVSARGRGAELPPADRNLHELSMQCEGKAMKTSEFEADEDLLKSTIADFEKHIISSALEQTGGNQNKAAMRLGTTKRILSYRVRKYGIDLGKFYKGGDKNKDKREE
jgi:transcriptional regulator with GAF, ATPase, and Fis domain